MSDIESTDKSRLESLYRSRFGCNAAEVAPLRAHGSDRRIHRLSGDGGTVIGVVNGAAAENRAFIAFSRHFRKIDLPVPEVLAVSSDEIAYLEEDLGDTALFDLLEPGPPGSEGTISTEADAVYRKAVRLLPRFQVRGVRDLDLSVCFPRSRFDRQSMAWDLNHFKYYFLKPANIPFHEQELESDFSALANHLVSAPSDYFLYRDFQSRNIMVRDGNPWFIDFQGGRLGALQYDIASLLLDAKANLSFALRESLLGDYLDALGELVPVDREQFLSFLDAFALIRIIQAMGTYGYRGFHQRKPHFLQSVPYAIRNLEALLGSVRFPVRLPALFEVLHHVVRSPGLRKNAPAEVPLTVRVESFSFRQGYPADQSGHGGGFVFDCRLLPNPGREERYRENLGTDPEVVSWLESRPEVETFLGRVFDMIDGVIDSYASRNYAHLAVSFGCTGGQHRSVYCAERLARHLRNTKGVKAIVSHRDAPVREKITGT